MYAEHYNAGHRERYVSSRRLYFDGYELIDRCNRMIERNLKDARTMVDTKFAYDASLRKSACM